MTELEALILGLLQGATEFLPVSSSGHLVMGQELLGLTLPGISFEVTVHLATLVSVVVVYRTRLARLARGAIAREAEAWRYLGLLAVGTVPAAIVGIGFREPVGRLFEAPTVVGVSLLVTGAALFSARWVLVRPEAVPVSAAPDTLPSLTARVALLIGVAQCMALVPGISRSGSTVVAALWLGVPAVEAAAFSFLLSIPAIAGAAILQLPELSGGTEGVGALALAVGFGVAAATGVLAITLFVRMLTNRAFPHFAWYCWGVGLLFLAWMLAGG